MKIVHYNNIDFDIDSAGRITRKSTWHVMPDTEVTANWNEFAEAVKNWAGDKGDFWRKPDNSSTNYGEDQNYVVTAISFKSRARYMYEVTFTGQLSGTKAEMLGQVELSVNENGEKEKSARWLVHTDKLDSFLPSVGDVLSWAGTLYCCSRVDCRDVGGGRYEVTLRTRDMAVLMVGLPTYRKTAKLECVKSAKWRVAAAAYGDFITANEINSDASTWAGGGYYVTAINAVPIGQAGYYVTLEAKHVAVRVIDIRRSVKFLRYNVDGSVANEVIYTGRWQVHKDNIDEFNQMSGTSAADWADSNFIVTGIEPIKLSEMEYQVTLTARSIASQSLYAQFHYDDRSNLSSRKDFKIGYSELKLTPEQCGWSIQDSVWIKLNRLKAQSWAAATDCPLKTSSELNWSLSQTPLRTLTVTVTEYKFGNVALYVNEMAQWDSSDVLDGFSVGNYSGSWRKIDQQAELVLDNLGKFWTKITRHYQKAPGQLSWNSSYNGFRKVL